MNYPIWRRHNTRKKKQVCGAACFLAAESKFSEDVCPSVHLSCMPCPLCGSLPISWIIFICGINTTQEGTMCRVPLSGQRSRSHVLLKFSSESAPWLADYLTDLLHVALIQPMSLAPFPDQRSRSHRSLKFFALSAPWFGDNSMDFLHY